MKRKGGSKKRLDEKCGKKKKWSKFIIGEITLRKIKKKKNI